MPQVELLEIDARGARVDLEEVTLNDLMGVLFLTTIDQLTLPGWSVHSNPIKPRRFELPTKRSFDNFISEWVTKDSVQCQQDFTNVSFLTPIFFTTGGTHLRLQNLLGGPE